MGTWNRTIRFKDGSVAVQREPGAVYQVYWERDGKPAPNSEADRFVKERKVNVLA